MAQPEPVTASDRLRRGFSACCWVPPVWLGLFALLVVRARLHLGTWPYPAGEVTIGPGGPVRDYPLDPKHFVAHHAALVLGSSVLIGSFLLAPLLLGLRFSGKCGRPSALGMRAYLVSTVAIAFLWTLDPGRYWEWFLD